nr:hypothetical protein [Borreliella turdi]WKC78986.1 hypothetical protein QIA30_03155 [Borreliella turdi]
MFLLILNVTISTALLAVSKFIVRSFNLNIYSHIHINGFCVYPFAMLFTCSYKAYFSFIVSYWK